MKRKMISIAVAAVLLQAGCANNDSGRPAAAPRDDGSGPIKVGVIVPLSGPAGPNGKDVLAAIKAQAQLVNQDGGVSGRKLQIVARDDQSESATGVTAANELVREGVSVVMGGWNSPVTLAIQPVLVRAGVLNITTIPQNASILGGADPHAVRMNAGNAVGAYAAGRYISSSLDADDVSMLLENDAYGEDAGAQLAKELEKTGVDVAGRQKFDYTESDFRVPLSNVAKQKPDVVFSANAAESSGMPALAEQYVESGTEATHFAALGTVSPTVVKLAGGKKADGLVSADLYFPDVKPFSGYPANNRFVEVFQKETGKLPDKYAALGAVSVDVWADAVEKAGTTDRAKVSEAIRGNEFDDTVLGDVRFTDHGQLVSRVYAFTVDDGKLKVRHEIPVPGNVWEK